MARTAEARERHAYRKTQTMLEQTHGGNAGRSIREMLIEQLDAAMHRHLDATTDKERSTTRGEVRGLARAVALMTNPYYPVRGIKTAEAESASRVRRARHAQEHQDAQAAEQAEPGA